MEFKEVITYTLDSLAGMTPAEMWGLAYMSTQECNNPVYASEILDDIISHYVVRYCDNAKKILIRNDYIQDSEIIIALRGQLLTVTFTDNANDFSDGTVWTIDELMDFFE